ncbi:MAG: class I SAM-dependent methyltransferase [Thermoleophilaceae bacterium]
MRATDAAAVFDRVADTYDRVAFPFFTAFGEALVEFAGVGRDDRVLDVGCGAGAALAPVSQIAAYTVGIEMSAAMAARAREAAPVAEVVEGDAAALPFADASFDVVVSSFVVFFIDDPAAALREWRRVLAPEGRLAMATWAAADPRWGFESELRREFLPEMDPDAVTELPAGLALLNRFNEPGKVKKELRGAGFEPERVEPFAIDFVFEDEQAWWAWNWSHASRVFLEALPEDARERYRERAFEAMQSLREGEGFPRTYTAVFADARRAD